MHHTVHRLPWSAENDYQAIRTTLIGGSRMPPDFGAWAAKAESIERQIQRQGGAVKRVAVNSVAFSTWCRQAGRMPDEAVLMDYVRVPKWRPNRKPLVEFG